MASRRCLTYCFIEAASILWNRYLKLGHVSWVVPANFGQFITQWSASNPQKKGEISATIIHATHWAIWTNVTEGCSTSAGAEDLLWNTSLFFRVFGIEIVKI